MTKKKTTKKKAAKKVAKKTTKKTAKKTTSRKTTKKTASKAKTKKFVFDYDPAPESKAIVNIKSKYQHFIGGEFVAPEAGKYMDTINPATTEVLAKVAVGNEKDVDKAVKAARKALSGTWGQMSGSERGKYLFRIARILQERAREFAVLETLDGGKPIKESRDVDIPLAAAHFFITQAGQIRFNMQFQEERQGLSAFVVRLFRGTSHFLWQHGNSLLLSQLEIR